MGYSTDFFGVFNVTPKLKQEDNEFLTKLAQTRRMKRDVTKLPPGYWGVEGEFYVDGEGDYGQTKDASVIDYNTPPSTQPGLWLQWIPSDDGETIQWDGGEKFYNYVEWLEYLIEMILSPRGYVLNGEVEWQGEETDDRGKIVVEKNLIMIKRGRIVYD